MAAYLYVLWAVEDELVKIGISRRLHKRLSAHSGNSSNPLNFRRWRLYQFTELSDAQKIERLAAKRLAKGGFLYRGKRELFKCKPTIATDIIDEACGEAKISALKDFPFDLTEMLQTFADFPCLPDYALELLIPEQRKMYWKGAHDALRCLTYFDGMLME
jgi:hypothetical protein